MIYTREDKAPLSSLAYVIVNLGQEPLSNLFFGNSSLTDKRMHFLLKGG